MQLASQNCIALASSLQIKKLPTYVSPYNNHCTRTRTHLVVGVLALLPHGVMARADDDTEDEDTDEDTDAAERAESDVEGELCGWRGSGSGSPALESAKAAAAEVRR
jgi:hypothetical protein